MTRRHMLAASTFAACFPRISSAESFPSHRPAPAARKFVSPAVEQQLARVKAQIADPELAWMFENCFPNTLDTTVNFQKLNGVADTFVITGDIDCHVAPRLFRSGLALSAFGERRPCFAGNVGRPHPASVALHID